MLESTPVNTDYWIKCLVPFTNFVGVKVEPDV